LLDDKESMLRQSPQRGKAGQIKGASRAKACFTCDTLMVHAKRTEERIMELFETLIEKASPLIVAFFWVLVVGTLAASLTRNALARTFLQYVANTTDEPNQSPPKRHYA
jgi:hypothetical protein